MGRPIVVNAAGDPICWPNNPEHAPLIAAAPALLAALQELMDSRASGSLTNREVAARGLARLAICQAQGRS